MKPLPHLPPPPQKPTESAEAPRTSKPWPPAKARAIEAALDLLRIELDCRAIRRTLSRLDDEMERARLLEAIRALSATLDELPERLRRIERQVEALDTRERP